MLRSLSKTELVSMHSISQQEKQPGAFLRRYKHASHPVQPAHVDLSQQETVSTQSLSRITAEHDLREIALAYSINKLIYDFLHDHGKLPDVIRIHPESAAALYDGGFCVNQRFRYDYKRWTAVFIPLQVDRRVKNTAILLDHYKPAC
ncbi:MAG TPA: hypothetical protein VL461_09645 [Dictyobacter sp.]|nr:hypothetical protein [Dictyobacter sp.]